MENENIQNNEKLNNLNNSNMNSSYSTNNGGMKAMIVILIIIILGLVGYLVYDNFIKNDKKNEPKMDDKVDDNNNKTNENDENSIEKNFNAGNGSKIYFVWNKYDVFAPSVNSSEHKSIRVAYEKSDITDNDEILFEYNCKVDNGDKCVGRTYFGINDFLIHDDGITYIYNYKTKEIIQLPKKTAPLTIDFYAYVITDFDRIIGIGYYDAEASYPNNTIFFNMKTKKYTENTTNRDFKNINLKELTSSDNVIVYNYVQVSLIDDNDIDNYNGLYVVDVNNNDILFDSYSNYRKFHYLVKFSDVDNRILYARIFLDSDYRQVSVKYLDSAFNYAGEMAR